MEFIDQEKKFKNIVNKVSVYVEYSNAQTFDQLNKLDDIVAIDFNNGFGIVFTPIEKIALIDSYIKNRVYEEAPAIYTLTAISPQDAAGALVYHNNPYIPLSGKGVIVGIVDTGIDYLNEEFIREDDTTKIIRIWDQSIESEEVVYGLMFGTEYTEKEINEAIRVKKSGGDPYSIVPSKDEIGHGTAMAGIVGGIGKNQELKGMAPDCQIAMVKMQEATKAQLEFSGVTTEGRGRYGTGTVLTAVRYLERLANEVGKPVVIFIPVGTTVGAHDGTSNLEVYIDEISKTLGIVVVADTGNQGDADTHVEGRIEKTGQSIPIELRIGENQKTIDFKIWFSIPDRVSLDVISPSGERWGGIPAKFNQKYSGKFIYEGTFMDIEYFIPEELTGEEVISIRARNLSPGLWKFILTGDYIVDGRYWSWLPQDKLLAPGTKFLSPSQYTTLAIPATAKSVIVAANYDQNNNGVISQSGRGFTRDGRIKPDIAGGGQNAIVAKPGGGTAVMSGGSVAGAVLAGTCVIMLQWGIVDKNDPRMYANKLRGYIVRGAKLRSGDQYPNENWGYGMLDIPGIFSAIRSTNLQARGNHYDEYDVGKLFISKPFDL
ncbi:S8 family peptidase [Clostridium septicum]|uniref:S8 family peptidase n=1 Tax=Clostridium septicum TaxID=1504 RepID=UPI00082E7EC5|nr:S8 family peptidase [Clostridium septicum]MDU1312544.1 S8 family peptidase [Clostridium septicum]WLF69540.1 S8 family peptidase [Clostridium septicum]